MDKEWESISMELDISEKWCLKLHARALENFSRNNLEFILHWRDIFHGQSIEGNDE